MPWICASCTAEHESNDPPCRKCGHEQFAELDETTSTPRVETATHVEWECPDCGTAHPRNNPPCDSCGSMQLAKADGGITSMAQSTQSDDAGQSLISSAGDILFNKSLTRQLVDLELLLITGFTWIFFLITELVYHHWKLGKDEETQFSHKGGIGEGPITKLAKGLFWIQIGLIALGTVLFVLALLA